MSHTKEIAAREAKNRFGELLDFAQRAPVRITKNGRSIAVLVSDAEYEWLEKLDDAYWGTRAMEAEKEGEWLGPKETEALLKRILKKNAAA